MSHPKSSSGVWRRETGLVCLLKGNWGQRDRQSSPIREAQALGLACCAKRAWPPSCKGVSAAVNISQNP